MPWARTGLEILRTDDFRSGRLSRRGTYGVCFAAAWCPVTRRFVPRFVARRREFPGTLAIADITDLRDPLWDDFRIRITPSIVVFVEGVERQRLDGRRFFGIRESKWRRLVESLRAPSADPGAPNPAR